VPEAAYESKRERVLISISEEVEQAKQIEGNEVESKEAKESLIQVGDNKWVSFKPYTVYHAPASIRFKGTGIVFMSLQYVAIGLVAAVAAKG